MEQQVNHDERRRAAVEFLHELLDRHAGRASEEIAESITGLAYDDNPVRDLFISANSTSAFLQPHVIHPTKI